MPTVLTQYPKDDDWSRLSELNRRPSNYESDALPTELSRLGKRENCGVFAPFRTIRRRSLRCQAAESGVESDQMNVTE